MLKILIVEDDQRKLQKITRVLTDIEGVEVEQITPVVDAYSAKVRLKDHAYDLLILDIAIPPRIDRDVEIDEGIKLLEEIMERDLYKIPTHIVGITAYSDIYLEAQGRFSERLLTVISYDDTSEDWVYGLRARVKHILLAKKSNESESKEYESHLAVVCALETPELSSILDLDWSWTLIRVQGDETSYHQGCFFKEDKRKIVHAAFAARKGMPAASILAMKMISAFRPEYLAMAGITAGNPARTKFGDIIAADPSWDWGSGKWIVKDGKLIFLPAPHQLSLSPKIRNMLKQMSADSESLFRIRQNWPADKPSDELSLLVGPLASGASVLADGTTAELVKQQHREILGIEMETYAIFAAAEEAPAPRPTAFSLKSVVDFADGEKDDRFQKYAAFTSAQALKHFTERYL